MRYTLHNPGGHHCAIALAHAVPATSLPPVLQQYDVSHFGGPVMVTSVRVPARSVNRVLTILYNLGWRAQ